MIQDSTKEINDTEMNLQDNENWLLSLENYNGDTLDDQESDWWLEGDSDLMKKIRELPPVPRYRFIANQYHLPEWKTSCTKFAAMNGLWNDIGYEPTIDDIFRIEERSLRAGRGGTGRGWFRAGGVDVVRNDWNERNPENEVASFLLTLFSDEFWAYLDTGRCIVVSINVNLRFWADVLSDGRLDDMNFGSGGGHATVMYKESDGVVRFIDSIGTTRSGLWGGRSYTMTYGQLKDKVQRLFTMQQNCHIFIPKIIVPMIARDVPANQWFSEVVKEMIDKGIMTANAEGIFRPNANLTRAEQAMVVSRILKKMEEMKSEILTKANAAMLSQIQELIKMVESLKK